MRTSLLVTLCGVLLATMGCTGTKTVDDNGKPAVIVTPDSTLIGKVVFVNPAARYVVLGFPTGRMPAAGQSLHVFRDGMKVGEVKVAPLKRDENVVADITAGEAQLGDQVKDR